MDQLYLFLVENWDRLGILGTVVLAFWRQHQASRETVAKLDALMQRNSEEHRDLIAAIHEERAAAKEGLGALLEKTAQMHRDMFEQFRDLSRENRQAHEKFIESLAELNAKIKQ